MLDKHPDIAVPPTCCHDGVDAARQGHLACLQSLRKQRIFLRLHDHGRAKAGEVRRAEACLAALAACDGRHPEILKWLLAEGWPLSETERFPWHFRDVADPSLLTWYTGGRPSLMPRRKPFESSLESPLLDVTAIDWGAEGDWSEMGNMAGLHDPQSKNFFQKLNGGIRIWGKSWVHEAWYPQEFQVLWRACRSGDLTCQQIIVEAGCRSLWVTVLAALAGQLEFLRFAIKQGCPCKGPSLVAAAAGGHVDCFKQVLKVPFNIVEKVLSWFWRNKKPVREGGQYCLPDWLFRVRIERDYGMLPWNTDLDGENLEVWILKAALAAAENGHLEVLKFIMTRHAQSIRQTGLANLASAAVARGRLSCLEFACKCGCIPDPKSVEVALRTGHTDCLPYLMSHGIKMTSSLSFLIGLRGHLELLELQAAQEKLTLNEWGPRPDEAALDNTDGAMGAARGDQLACLQFTLQKGDPGSPESLLRDAAAGGDVMCMRYLHEKGYGAAEGTLCAAVQSGGLQCTKYAFEIGCPQEESLMVKAAGLGVAFVQCLHERGCPWEEGTTQTAAWRGCLATLQYCHEHGCSWGCGVIEAAIWAGSAACLQYIHTHKCPPLPWFCPPAYNLEVLQYGVENMGTWSEHLLQATSKNLHEEDQHQFADWRLLMYMSQKGVALPPVLQWAADLRFARFKAVVSCFHLATHLAVHGGPHALMWSAMGMIPQVVLEKITQLAHLKV